MDISAQLNYMRWLAASKKAKRRPEGMVFVFGHGGLAAQAVQNVVAASFVRRYPQARALALLRDTAEAGILLDCNPFIRCEMRMEGEVTGLVDWFDIGFGAPVKCPDPNWVENKHINADVVFLPHMLSVPPARLEGFAEAPGYLCLPPSKQAELWPLLERAGLERERWFAVVQAGGEGAEAKADPMSYLPVVDALLRRGGQVVRLGDPGEAALPDRPGLFDLRAAPPPLRVAAIAAARLVVGGDGTVATLASAFAVPCALTNAVGYGQRVWRPESIVLAKTVELADGSRLDTPAAFARGFLDGTGDAAVVARHDNQPDELAAVALALHDDTADCPGWRPGLTPVAGPPLDDGVAFPLRLAAAPRVRFWPARALIPTSH